jgi:hypothetical protein
MEHFTIMTQYYGKKILMGTQVSSTNKTDRHDITEILLKVVLSTINQTKPSKTRRQKSLEF